MKTKYQKRTGYNHYHGAPPWRWSRKQSGQCAVIGRRCAAVNQLSQAASLIEACTEPPVPNKPYGFCGVHVYVLSHSLGGIMDKYYGARFCWENSRLVSMRVPLCQVYLGHCCHSPGHPVMLSSDLSRHHGVNIELKIGPRLYCSLHECVQAAVNVSVQEFPGRG